MENEINTLKNIEFFHQAEETKDIIFLFKSIEEVQLVTKKMNEKSHQKKTKSLALITNTSEENIIEIVHSLSKIYKTIAFSTNLNDFTTEEIFNISLKTGIPLNESSSVSFSFYASENLISTLIDKINKNGQKLIGKKIKLSNDSGSFLESEGLQKYLFYKNMLIKVWVEIKNKGKGTSNVAYFEVLTNYAFKIQEIIINADDEYQRQDLKIELTDIEGNISYVQISAKDKYSIAGFRKIVCQSGSYVDFMTNVDFNKVINQLYLQKKYKTVYQHTQPGLMPNGNVWLLADEVISLED